MPRQVDGIGTILMRTPERHNTYTVLLQTRGGPMQFVMPRDTFHMALEHSATDLAGDLRVAYRGYEVDVPTLGTLRFLTSFRTAP